MILPVERPDDPALAVYRRVGDHEWLRANGLFVAEGRLITERLLRAGAYRVHSVLVTPPARAALEPLLRDLEAPVLVAPPALLIEITGFNFHRGCLALAARRAPGVLADVAQANRLLGLEAIGNPDNVGGLFRTAAAFGAGGVLFDRRTADPFYRKALRTSMGAVLEMAAVPIDDWREEFEQLRTEGWRVIALTPEPSATPLTDFVREQRGGRVLLMVGSEGRGLTLDVLCAADDRVRVPIAPGVDSLNVTVAAGIALSRMAEGE